MADYGRPRRNRQRTYTEIAEVLETLPLLMRETRRRRQISQREAARELRFSFATVSRIEDGAEIMLGNALAVLRWREDQPA